MKNNINFIIYTHRYNDDTGGIVVLHKLCHLLNELGFKAYLWPSYRPIFNNRIPFKSVRKILKYYRKEFHRSFSTNSNWNTPIASKTHLKDSIVIYPEVVDGNPLKAKNVVRWLLHKPGFHSGSVNYGKNELIFFYLKAYIENLSNIDINNLLYIPNNREDTYVQTNFGAREGSCYILRKGKNRKIVHELGNSILIDGKSHHEIAQIFNNVEYCISYDTYTMYSMYASMCGCKSVVVPEDGISKEEWLPDEEKRYGIAYGFDDLKTFDLSRKLLFERFEQEKLQTSIQINNFVIKCEEYFINKNGNKN
jgi:hypothetical protein